MNMKLDKDLITLLFSIFQECLLLNIMKKKVGVRVECS